MNCIRIEDKYDGIERLYHKNSKMRFIQWFNMNNVPELSMVDELFIKNEKDYQNKKDKILSLKVGQSCIVENNVCIITRVK